MSPHGMILVSLQVHAILRGREGMAGGGLARAVHRKVLKTHAVTRSWALARAAVSESIPTDIAMTKVRKLLLPKGRREAA